MFGGLASKKGLLAKKGGAADVTPNAVNWTQVTLLESTTQTITGISSSITLRLNLYGYSFGSWYVYINDVGYSMTGDLENDGYYDFEASNNDVIYFTTSSSQLSRTFDIINLSDGNALLDTIELGGGAA